MENIRNFADRYFDILFGELAGLNLTAIRDRDSFYNLQILDSLYPALHCKNLNESIQKSSITIDIGFGGGFPLLVLANEFPKSKFIGFEARRKKVDAVNLIAQRLGLNNVVAHHRRIEEIEIDKSATIVLKAVGKAQDYLPKINFSNKPLECYFYKSNKFYDDELPFLAKLNNWSLFLEDEIEVPSTDKRLIIGFKPKNVPRRTYKNLAKLSEFL